MFGGTAHGGSGDDQLRGIVEVTESLMDAKTRPFVLDGGRGNDTINTPHVYDYDGQDESRPLSCGTVERCRITARGGAGADVLAMDRSSGSTTVDLRRGTVDYALGRGTARSFEKVEGSKAADRIYGTDRREHLDGNGGRDLLVGRGGPDVLHGGKGHDVVDGGPGRDRCEGETRRSC